MINTRSRELEQINTHLLEGFPVLIEGPSGVGKTALALAAVQAYARTLHNSHIVRLSAGYLTRSLPGEVFGALLGGEATSDDPLLLRRLVEEALARRPGSAILVVDDAHNIDAVSEHVVESLIRAGEVRIVMTARALPVETPRLRRLVQDGVVHALSLGDLALEHRPTLIRSILAPHPVETETMATILGSSGGNPFVIEQYLRALIRTGGLTLIRDTYVWTGSQDGAGILDDLTDVALGALAPENIHAAELVAIAAPAGEDRIQALVGERAVRELVASGLIRVVRSEGHSRLEYVHDLIGATVRERLSPARRRELFGLISSQGFEGEQGHWGISERRRYVVLAGECGVQLPLDLLTQTWDDSRTQHAMGFHIVVSDAIQAHPETSPSRRIEAIAAGIEARRLTCHFPEAGAQVAHGDALLEEYGDAVSAQARLRYAHARVNLLQLHLDLNDEAFDYLHEVRAEIVAQGADRELITQLDAEYATRLGFAGRGKEAYAALKLVHDERPAALTLLPTIASYGMILAQRGENVAARRLTARNFLISMKYVAEYPLGPSEVVVADFFGDMVAGRYARAAATQSRLKTVLMRGGRKLPPYDLSLTRGGDGVVDIAYGRWSDAIEALSTSVARYDLADPNNFGGFLLAHLAVAQAASGAVEEALYSSREARARLTGSSRVVEPYCQSLILLAHVWCEVDVEELALELADRSHEEELFMVELRALHVAAMHGRAAAVSVRRRAERLGEQLEGTMAQAFVTHIQELAENTALRDGHGARLLARHGVIVPLRTSPAELTSREQEVAAIATLGFPTKLIAQRFGVSKRTIDAHLNRIYLKLGVDGRDGLAEILDRYHV